MPEYRVIIPAYTRVEEIHLVEADSEEEARELALDGRDPNETVDDPDYYEIARDGIRIEEA